ncbi:hypothetical protein [Euhalothece natronophila]|nr:hypothetical protein [Euhalothece natronophila]
MVKYLLDTDHFSFLLTRNVADFNKIPDLRIEDWTVDPQIS